MRAFLRKWFGWLAVPVLVALGPRPDPEAIPPGLYVFAPGERVTGLEPVSFFLAHRREDADRVIMTYGGVA